MSRDQGFARADIDTSLLADPKVVALVRRIRDPQRTAAAVMLYTGLVLASWKAGARLTLEESLPAWWLDDVDEVLEQLRAVALVDEDGRIPVHAWSARFQPAFDKREALRDKWDRANKSRGNRGGTAEVPPESPRHHDTTRHDTSDTTRRLAVVATTAEGDTPLRHAAAPRRADPGGLDGDRA